MKRRPTTPEGIPIRAEYIEELDGLFMRLEKRSLKEQLSRAEQVIVDVYYAIGTIEGDGIHAFWNGCEFPSRVIESLRLFGASALSDIIESSQWAISILAKGTDAKGCYFFTDEQEKTLEACESEMYCMFIGLPTKLLEYAKKNMIS